MKLGEHSLREHVRFLAPLFGFVAAVWMLRLVVYQAGAPHGVFHVLSVTVATAVAVLLAVVMMHLRGFGSYASVAASTFLLVAWDQLLVSAAIVFTALTGIQDVYSAPEYSFRMSYAAHIGSQMTYGIGWGTLFGAATGCLLLWLLRRAVPLHHARLPLRQSSEAGHRAVKGKA